MAAGEGDTASYIRGRLHLARVDQRTPLCTALDVLMTVVVDVPTDTLKEWRQKFDQAMWKVRPPDRDSWGLDPAAQAAMARLAGVPLGK